MTNTSTLLVQKSSCLEKVGWANLPL